MKQRGLMQMEFKHGHYFAILQGDTITAWKKDETDAFYTGLIDGIETAEPELFKALIEQGAIKLSK